MSAKAEIQKTGADILAELLQLHGVTKIFCISGAGNLAIIDALRRHETIEIVYSHHEQAAVMEAQGYSRVAGCVGVALVTTGGGSSNAVTGILSAHLDSVPILIISGNESSFHCSNMADFRAFGTQGFDSCSVAKPITKSSERIMTSDQITQLFHSAWQVMQQGRPGPALLDFPMDIQRTKIDSEHSLDQIVERSGNIHLSEPARQLMRDCTTALQAAEQPLLYFGNGVRNPSTLLIAKTLVEKLQLPFLLSWSAIDLFPDEHPLNVGRVGIYGDRAANILLQKSDLLICVGTRLSIPQTGYDKSDFARKAEKWVIDIDPIELTKFPLEGWNTICTSAEAFLEEALTLSFEGLQKSALADWVVEINRVKEALPKVEQVGPVRFGAQEVHSFEIMHELNQQMAMDATVVTDVGAGLLTGHFAIAIRGNQRMFTSQGLGEMGFGLPGAIGAYFADPSRQLVCLNTDGGIMFNLQELQVVQHHKIPIKLFIFNNSGYSMIRISQENLFAGRYSGIDQSTGVSFPSFENVARTFGMEYKSIDDYGSLAMDISEVLASDGPILIDVRMAQTQKYFPRLATSTMPDGSFISPPLEDLDPKISLEQLRNLLGYEPAASSVAIRKGVN